MSELKTKVIKHILGIEGKFGDDIDDSGGATNFGITERVARAHGYEGKMKYLTVDMAVEIYNKRYWNRLCLDEIGSLSEIIARELMDTGVNQGTKRAALYLQRSLNVLNDRGRLYRDIMADGDIGPTTIRTLNAYLRHRSTEGEQVLFKMLNCLQGAFYVNLSERRIKDEKFIYGWFKHRIQ